MKIIALIPVKNESWALPSYLSSVTKIADEIIALDDNSTDASKDILEKAGVDVIGYDATREQVVDMSARRRRLLEAGRKAGGTHFIWLDADETFSADFIPRAKEVIAGLEIGQKITMRWVHAWKNTADYLTDKNSPFGCVWKDFIVCDDPKYTFEKKFLSESRTPGPHENVLKLPEKQGVVIHWQFSRWDITQLKQALYRCTELLEGSRSVRRINHTYSITLANDNLLIAPLPQSWIKDLTLPKISDDNNDFYLTQITKLFSEKGIVYFEGLQIWHIPELYNLFITQVGRPPRIKVFPSWLIAINKLRHAYKK
jgi:glycosyltransferase involved in cell wall biosynthesis